jgi:Flp pilus assembly protein TadB
MTAPLVAAAGAILIGAGLLTIVAAFRAPAAGATPRRFRDLRRGLRAIATLSRRLTRVGVVAAAAAGLLVWVLSGWAVAAVILPAAAVVVPSLLRVPDTKRTIKRLEAMEEWTRSLSGVLTVGVGLEEALVATLRSAPEPIRPEVAQLVARLRARWSTEDALRMFADDLDDATGDLVAANLILGARRRGAGVASVLDSLAESVAADVRARRAIEADRAKPRATARWVTLITIGVLAVLALTGSYISPYGTPLGQMILILLLSLYVATLVWMRRMAAGKPLPRFIGMSASQQARP